MKERPILFGGDMIRAILAGTKSQTRRIVKPQPQGNDDVWPDDRSCLWWRSIVGDTDYYVACGWCPFGKPGDRLWCRETWAPRNIDGIEQHFGNALYKADYGDVEMFSTARWRPSIHMPRWASRVTLEITAIRVERLQDISEADCCAELGAPLAWQGPDPEPYQRNLRGAFAGLWDSLNKPGYRWVDNSWVWCLSFRRLT